MPGYSGYERVAREMPEAVKSGAVAAHWVDGGRAVEYMRDGRQYRFDVATRHESETVQPVASDAPERHRAIQIPERGRQSTSAVSPDGGHVAVYRDRNVYVGASDGTNQVAVTTDGSAGTRVKYGTASWVYGEEFEQRTAMWWSPDGQKLAYYRFDEQRVPDFYLALNMTRLQSTLDSEAYPLAGAPNPVVDLFVYDLTTQRSTRIDVRSGKPFDDDVMGHYVYRIEWTKDGGELLFLRTNRRQNVMEVVAADPETGACRVVVRESWPTGWVNEDPRLVFLSDGKRFIWESQRTGWDNFYLYDLTGRLVRPLTAHTTFEVGTLVKIDEQAGVVFYTAHDGDNAMKLQLHRVGLDGGRDGRLTDPAFYHTVGSCLPGVRPRLGQPVPPAPCGISADDKYFVDILQTHDTAPATRIVDAATGRSIGQLATSDLTTFHALGLRNVELFPFTAADGHTTLHGLIHFPSAFDRSRKYPVLVNVYSGPEFTSNTARETFVTPSTLTELGFLVLNLDTRAIPAIGKRTLDSIYMNLGQADVDDLASGVRALWDRPYLDRTRVGIFGGSYGGYTALMGLLRHPEVFAAAAVSSSPTDWRNYDTVYTERYMATPQENPSGYDAANPLRYARDLRGRLLIYYGTADNNVHPSNSLQLIKALQDAGKSFDVQVGPDRGHGGLNQDRMMEFFIDALKP